MTKLQKIKYAFVWLVLGGIAWAFYDMYASCSAAGGTLVRGLVWMECLK